MFSCLIFSKELKVYSMFTQVYSGLLHSNAIPQSHSLASPKSWQVKEYAEAVESGVHELPEQLLPAAEAMGAVNLE